MSHQCINCLCWFEPADACPYCGYPVGKTDTFRKLTAGFETPGKDVIVIHRDNIPPQALYFQQIGRSIRQSKKSSDNITDNPNAYAVMRALEKIRGSKYPHKLITDVYKFTCEHITFLFIEGDEIHNYNERAACNEKRANFFHGILIGYDIAIGKNNIVKQ